MAIPNDRLRLLIAGGGTGGHLFPAVAVAEALLEQRPRSKVLFVGSTGGLETRVIPARGFQLETLPAGKIKGTSFVTKLRTLVGLGPTIARASLILKRFSPDVVVGVGGYASVPVVTAAWLARPLRPVPIVLLEQNAIAGITNRQLGRLADRVVVSHASAERFFAPSKAIFLGNPVRREIVAGLAKPRDPRSTASGVKETRLLVLGGSQGAHRINELVSGAAERLLEALPGLRIDHQTGAADHGWVSERYSSSDRARAFAFVEDMTAAYRNADLVLSRSGATTLAELTIAGKPALLVPYPFAADDHQAANAAELVAAGAAQMRRQSELDVDSLGDWLLDLLADDVSRRRMALAMRGCGRPDAASDVVKLLVELAAR